MKEHKALYRVLIVHESYAQSGGEDVAVHSLRRLLESQGHRVFDWRESNAGLQDAPLREKPGLFLNTVWSVSSARRMRSLIQSHRPDIVHVHNTLPLLSPSILQAAHSLGLPVVVTLHNYRLMCPAGTYLRNGSICEDCQVYSLLRGIRYRCYRESRIQTTAVALMLAVNRTLGIWRRCVDAFIAQTEFMRRKVVEGGLPADRVHVLSNPLVLHSPAVQQPSGYAIFVGRLSEEKGIHLLLDAARLLSGVRLKILGSGPLSNEVLSVSHLKELDLEYLGELPHERTIELIACATVLVFPSIWYEALGLTILEAFSCGVPVVASSLGGRSELVADGENGLLFQPGDAPDLARKVLRIMTDGGLRARMSQAARDTFETRYSSQKGYQSLMGIYARALHSARKRNPAA